MCNINVFKVNIFSKIILFIIFISFTVFAHPHSNDELKASPHTHIQNKNDLIYKHNEFNKPDSSSYNTSNNTYSKQDQEKKKLVLFDDNLYLLDNELDLQKMELNADDLQIAKEYEDFLNSFFQEAILIGNKTSSSNTYTKEDFIYLNSRINELESEKQILNQKIENLEKQLQSDINSTEINDFESERRLLTQKIANLEKQLQSPKSDKSYEDVQEEYDKFNPEQILLEKTANLSDMSGFGITAIMGFTLPIMQSGLGIGPNFGLRLDTPISFTLVGKEVKVGTDLYSSIMSSNDTPWYTTTNIIGNISISIMSTMEIRSGLGLTSAKIGEDKKIALSLPGAITYYLPRNFSGFNIGLNLHGQLFLGHPTGFASTTSFITAGLVIITPIRF